MTERGGMNQLRLFLLTLFLSFLAVPAFALEDPISLFSSTPLRVDVDLVNVAFNVFDKNQRHVEHFQKADLVLFEDEVQQKISVFGQENTSLSIILLVDVSESLAPFIKQVESMNRLLPKVFEAGDEVAVIAFSDSPKILQDFTQDTTKIRTALEQPLLASKGAAPMKDSFYFAGATNINDSVYLASKMLEMSGPEKRRMIILLSDGMGNRGDSARAYEEVKTSGAALIGIGLGLTAKFHRTSMLLSHWIKETGGALVLFSPEPELRDNLQSAFGKVRSRYGIAYSPSNKKKDGRYRRIRMEISRNSPYVLRNLTIRGPQGYFAPLEMIQH